MNSTACLLFFFLLRDTSVFVFTLTPTTNAAELAVSTFKCFCSSIVNPCCGLAQLVVSSFWEENWISWGEVVDEGYLSIYNDKPGPCFCRGDRCYLCQSLFLPLISLMFLPFLPTQPASSLFPVFLLVLLPLFLLPRCKEGSCVVF